MDNGRFDDAEEDVSRPGLPLKLESSSKTVRKFVLYFGYYWCES